MTIIEAGVAPRSARAVKQPAFDFARISTAHSGDMWLQSPD
jgi:hypothetical protein